MFLGRSLPGGGTLEAWTPGGTDTWGRSGGADSRGGLEWTLWAPGPEQALEWTLCALGPEPALAGAVEEPVLAGAVEEPALAGAVEEPALAGAVEEPALAGAVEERGYDV